MSATRARRLCVFARIAAPGTAKTRLAPALGETGAALLQDAMTSRVLAVARAAEAAGICGIEVRVADGPASAFATRRGQGLRCVGQGEGDLGERLARAVGGAFTDGCEAVAVIGTDSPGITVAAIAAAFTALRSTDAVVGPAHDGGYWLVGMRAAQPTAAVRGLFGAIPWGTDRVLAATIDAARGQGLRLRLLDPLGDVDVPADLARWHETAAVARDPAPRRIAVTGATGSLGAAFVTAALARWPGLRVTALVRPGSDEGARGSFTALRARHGRRIDVVVGDLAGVDGLPRDAGALRALCDADGGLWHFAADTTLCPRDDAARRRIHEVNDRGTARLLALLAQRDAPGPFFHVSTAYVCGRRDGCVYEETLDDARGFRNDYEASKFAAEWHVRERFAAGLRGAVLRPGVVVDGAAVRPDSTKIVEQIGAAIAAAVRGGEGRLVLRAAADAAIHAVRDDWVVPAMLGLAGHTEGRTFHLTARRPFVFAELAAAAERVAGLRIECAPDAPERSLRGLSRAVDRGLRPMRGYLEAASQLTFDRGNLERCLPGHAAAESLRLDELIAVRIAAGAETGSRERSRTGPRTVGPGRGELV